MQTPIMVMAGPTSAGPDGAATRYAPFAAGSQTSFWTTSLGDTRTPIATAGTISGCVVKFPTTITSGSFVVTLMHNGSASSVAGTITTGNDLTLTGTLVVAAGDDLAWRFVGSGSQTQTVVQVSCIFTATTSGQSTIFAVGASSAGTRYIAPGAYSAAARTDNETRSPIAAAGVTNSLYVRLSAAPGVGNSKIVTLYKNGSATAITVTISGTNSTGNITAQNISLAQGDVINLVETVTGTPTSSLTQCGLDWVPTTSGESLQFSAFTALQSASSAVYGNANGQFGGGTATESSVYNLAPCDFTAKKMFAVTSTAPGSGKSRAFTLRKSGASTSLVATISDANTTAADNADTPAIVAGDLLTILNTPTGTPAANSYSQIGWASYIVPSAPAGSAGSLLLLGVG